MLFRSVDHGPIQIYFSTEGVVYRFDNKIKEESAADPKEKAREELRELRQKMKSEKVKSGLRPMPPQPPATAQPTSQDSI